MPCSFLLATGNQYYMAASMAPTVETKLHEWIQFTVKVLSEPKPFRGCLNGLAFRGSNPAKHAHGIVTQT